MEEKEDSVLMPDLSGFNYKDAVAYLNAVGLELGEIYYDEGSTRRKVVLKQSVRPGKNIGKGNVVDLTFASDNPIKYLPSVYQESDFANGDVLKRFLWIIQHDINSITNKLDNIHEYFNPMETPSDFLYWIASWFSIDSNYLSSDEKSRLLVQNIVPLYQWRGTAIGMAKFLEIFTGIKPEIIEDFIPITAYEIFDNKLVERFIVKEEYSPYSFTVKFPVKNDYFDIKMMNKINAIIKLEKPAHSNYFIMFEEKEYISPDSFVIGKDIIDDNILF
jgi:phage tail-like protein